MRTLLSLGRRAWRAACLAGALAVLPVALPAQAWASPVVQLLQDVTVTGARVTLGDLFSDAGDAAGVVVARIQPGQMVVLDATQVQVIARTNGVDWGQPREPAPHLGAIDRRGARGGPSGGPQGRACSAGAGPIFTA